MAKTANKRKGGGASRKKKSGPAPGVMGYGDLPTSLVLIFPLFLAYGIGVMFSSTVNGVDFVTRLIFAAVGRDRTYYLIAHLVLGGAFLALILYLRSRRAIQWHAVGPMLLESAIYALTVGTFIIFVMDQLLGFFIAPDLDLGQTGEALVTSLGAGVHEELVFRLGLMAGGAALLTKTGMRVGPAVAFALLGSALIFSAAHHLGPLGDRFELDVFTYRVLAGIVFGVIFYFRSLAHAVYTHFLYDADVLILRS
jgi:hypothetical protein